MHGSLDDYKAAADELYLAAVGVDGLTGKKLARALRRLTAAADRFDAARTAHDWRAIRASVAELQEVA